MDFRLYWATLRGEARHDFAKRCETTVNHLNNVAYSGRRVGEGFAIRLERETDGAVTCEEMRPDVDWSYLRGTAPRAAGAFRPG